MLPQSISELGCEGVPEVQVYGPEPPGDPHNRACREGQGAVLYHHLHVLRNPQMAILRTARCQHRSIVTLCKIQY